jgi:hypothetical protein
MAKAGVHKRAVARAAKNRATFQALNQHWVGHRQTNAGKDLKVGHEWSDGQFRFRQISVEPNPNEAGHYYGTVEVIGFSD